MNKNRHKSIHKGLLLIGLIVSSNFLWCKTEPAKTNLSGPGKAYFNVLDYGAKPGANENASTGINAAIQAAKAVGGGIVYIPAGDYTCGPIELVSNLELYIEAGAILNFPAQNLPYTKGRNQSVECLTAVPLIGGHDLENVTIKGGGTITTSNAEWMKLKPRYGGSAAGVNWANLLKSLENKTPATEEEYLKAAPELRPPFILVMNCKNVTIEGIHIVGSPMWPVHILYSENVVVHGISIETYPGVHTGGIYLDSSSYVRISDCFIETGDDGIVIKSGKDADGLRVNRPTENVTITNCTVRRAHGAVTLGSETAGGLRNIVVSNMICEDTQVGIRIKSRRGRGGFIEDVRFDNWTMENVGEAIVVTNYYAMEGEVYTGDTTVVSNRTPVFRNIAISNITINHAKKVMSIDGLPEMPIEGLRITDLIASGKTGLRATNTTDLELHNVRINAEKGPAFIVSKAKELELDNVSTSKPLANTPVIRIETSPAAIVRNCKAYEGTDIFLSTTPDNLKNIILTGNVTGNAKKVTEETVTFGK
jgi:polygalacturonase